MRRDPYTFELSLTGSSEIAYGFTGHEQLDLFKLVNMNGRMYDPVVGRFLSPDPVLQFPNFTQGLNPYSYALNNPLRFTDPSGYSLIGQMAALAASVILFPVNPMLSIAAYSVIMTVDYAIEQGRNINLGQAFGYLMQNFVLSAVSMGGSNAIGSMFKEVGKLGRELLRASAHGVFNGTMRMAQGGKFEHGFLSGFVSSLGGSAMQSYGTSMSTMDKIVLSSVIGGTAEALGGGKFANGAVTGAYVMMLNHLADHGGSGFNRKKIAAKLGQRYENNETRIIAGSMVAESLLEITEPGELLTEFREVFDQTYGNQQSQEITEVYSTGIEIIKQVKQSFGQNTVTDGMLVKAAGIVITNVALLQVKNTILSQTIKYLDTQTYFKYVKPNEIRTIFGGGGGGGSW